MPDLQFILRPGKAHPGVAVSPSQLARLPDLMYQQSYITLERLGRILLLELRFQFYKMIHERPRNVAYEKGNAEHLLSRMEKAFTQALQGDQHSIKLMVFDLAYMDYVTRNEGFNTGSQGWFLRFADGHQGRRHGGVGWGFIDHDYAMTLAQEAAEKFIGSKKKRRAWLAEMDEAFKGRHGEGIMVRLDAPLFAALPEFGPAKDFVHPHPGFESWPAIGVVGQELTDRKGWVSDMIEAAFLKAVDMM